VGEGDDVSHKSYEIKADKADNTLDIDFDKLTHVVGVVKLDGQRVKPQDGARSLLFMRKSGGGEGRPVNIEEDGSFAADLEPATYSVGLD
jgi:hypothetical protein